jgi:hypothetical protein
VPDIPVTSTRGFGICDCDARRSPLAGSKHHGNSLPGKADSDLTSKTSCYWFSGLTTRVAHIVFHRPMWSPGTREACPP